MKEPFQKSLFLPAECLQEIFSYLHNDTLTLSKCLLVNKNWFENTASILWKSPFSQLQKPSKKLIEIYLKFLDIHTKTILTKAGIPLPSSASSIPEFNYSRYVRNLYYKGLYDAACEFIFGNGYYKKNLEGEKRCLLLVREISLFLIRKCPLIDVISYDMEEIYFYVQDIKDINLLSMNLVPEVCQLLKRTRKLIFGGKYEKGFLMNIISSYCKNLWTLEMNFYESDMYNNDGDRKDPYMMSSLLLAQKGLRNLIIRGSFRFLSDFLIPLESQANTLSFIQFERVQFNNSLPLKSVSTCKNLETIIFIDCINLDDEILEPLASVSFLLLKKLIFKNSHRLYLNNLAKLIRNTKGSLREIRFRRREFKNMVIRNVPDIPIKVTETISKYCPNLIIFEGHIEKETMPHFLEMITTTFIEKLFISVEVEESTLLQQLSYQLPNTLKHLSISIKNNFSIKDLKQFLELCSCPLLETLQFPQSNFINNQYLDIIIEFSKQQQQQFPPFSDNNFNNLKKVTFSKNSLITEKGIQKAKKFIPFVSKNGEEYV